MNLPRLCLLSLIEASDHGAMKLGLRPSMWRYKTRTHMPPGALFDSRNVEVASQYTNELSLGKFGKDEKMPTLHTWTTGA